MPEWVSLAVAGIAFLGVVITAFLARRSAKETNNRLDERLLSESKRIDERLEADRKERIQRWNEEKAHASHRFISELIDKVLKRALDGTNPTAQRVGREELLTLLEMGLLTEGWRTYVQRAADQILVSVVSTVREDAIETIELVLEPDPPTGDEHSEGTRA